MIPKDPYMLLSYINTQLRDNYTSLEDFCNSQDIEKELILSKLASVDYIYNADINQFSDL